MKRILFILFLFNMIWPYIGQCQKSGVVWCFGDSALIDFSDTANIITGRSIVNSRGSCASICDTSGNLLFYSAYDQDIFNGNIDPINIYSSNHQVMINGDSLKGGSWYHEIIILPFPESDSLYYVFHLGRAID